MIKTIRTIITLLGNLGTLLTLITKVRELFGSDQVKEVIQEVQKLFEALSPSEDNAKRPPGNAAGDSLGDSTGDADRKRRRFFRLRNLINRVNVARVGDIDGMDAESLSAETVMALSKKLVNLPSETA